MNQETHQQIAVKRLTREDENLEQRKIIFGLEQKKQISMTQDCFKKVNKMSDQFIIYLEPMSDEHDIASSQLKSLQPNFLPSEINIQAFWEIQKENPFILSDPFYRCFYRFRNVATGLYLCKREDQITLTFDG